MHFLMNIPNSWAFGKDLCFLLLAFGFQMLHQEGNLLAAGGRKSPAFKAPQNPPMFWDELHTSIVFQGFNSKKL